MGDTLTRRWPSFVNKELQGEVTFRLCNSLSLLFTTKELLSGVSVGEANA